MMWFIAAFTSPLARWMLGACVAFLIVTVAYFKGRLDCSALSQARQLQAEVTELQRQIQVGNELLEKARERESEQQNLQADLNGKLFDYERKLAKTPVPRACILSPADVERLRSISKS